MDTVCGPLLNSTLHVLVEFGTQCVHTREWGVCDGPSVREYDVNRMFHEQIDDCEMSVCAAEFSDLTNFIVRRSLWVGPDQHRSTAAPQHRST